MARRRTRSSGLGNAGRAEGWLDSAKSNFASIRRRHSRTNPCSLIEHYTDVVAEATVAEVLAHETSPTLAAQAEKLTRTATRAQRGAVAACRQGVRDRKL